MHIFCIVRTKAEPVLSSAFWKRAQEPDRKGPKRRVFAVGLDPLLNADAALNRAAKALSYSANALSY